MSTRRIREAYSVSSDEKRSFDEVYRDSKLFEETDDLIDPRFRKLFEEVYAGSNPDYKRLREAEEKGEFRWEDKAYEREAKEKAEDRSKKKESTVDEFLRMRESEYHMTRSPSEDGIEGIPSSLNSSEMGGGASPDIAETEPNQHDTSKLFDK